MNKRLLIAAAVVLAAMVWWAGRAQAPVAPVVDEDFRRVDCTLKSSPLDRQLEFEAEFDRPSSSDIVDAAVEDARARLLARTGSDDIHDAERLLWADGRQQAVLDDIDVALREAGFSHGPTHLFSAGPNLEQDPWALLVLHGAWVLDLDIQAHIGDPLRLSYGPPDAGPSARISVDGGELPTSEAATQRDLADRALYSVALVSAEDAPDQTREAVLDRVGRSRDALLLGLAARDAFERGWQEAPTRSYAAKTAANDIDNLVERGADFGSDKPYAEVLRMRGERLATMDSEALARAMELDEGLRWTETGPTVRDTLQAEVLYTRALVSPSTSFEHLELVVAPLAAFEQKHDLDPARRVFAANRAADLLTLHGRPDEAAPYRADALANQDRALLEPQRLLADQAVYDAFAGSCDATRQVLYETGRRQELGDACTSENYEQMCFDDVTGCRGLTESCQSDCGAPCTACERSCAADCRDCGDDVLCTEARVECSNTCLAERRGCRVDCSNVSSECRDEFNAMRAEACPDCSEMHDCAAGRDCTRFFPKNDEECTWWCYQP